LRLPLPIVRHSCPTFQQHRRRVYRHFRQMLGRRCLHQRIRQRTYWTSFMRHTLWTIKTRSVGAWRGSAHFGSTIRCLFAPTRIRRSPAMVKCNGGKRVGSSMKFLIASGRSTTRPTDAMIKIRKCGVKQISKNSSQIKRP
jgi:hypothetical protein